MAAAYFGSAEDRDTVWTGKDWVDSSSLVLFPIATARTAEHTQYSAEVQQILQSDLNRYR